MSAPVSTSPGLRLRIGHAVLDAGAWDAVLAAIEAQNGAARLPGLPDELNPDVIDPAKVGALLSALTPDALGPLAGRALFLDGPGLHVAGSSPTTPDGFAGARLHLVAEHGDTVSARADVAVDSALARRRAADARTRTAAAEDAVRTLEAAGGDAGGARLLRHAVARAWEENAAAVAGCTPGGQATADLEAARQAAGAALMLGGAME